VVFVVLAAFGWWVRVRVRGGGQEADFAALVPDPPEPRGGGDAAHAHWTPRATAAGLVFDHDRILADAHDRVGPSSDTSSRHGLLRARVRSR
jgi:hypothetical protein